MSDEEKQKQQPQEVPGEVGTEEQSLEAPGSPTGDEEESGPVEVSEGNEDQEAGTEKEEKAEQENESQDADPLTENSEEAIPGAEDAEQVEEVVLDEPDPDEENPPEPEPSSSEGKTAREEGSTEEKSAGGKQDRKAFFRRKIVVMPALGLFIAMGCAVLFFSRNSEKGHDLGALIYGQGKDAQSRVETVLKPFLVPLPADSEDVAVRLIIAVKWAPEILARYKNKPVPIRNDVYQHLLQVAGSKRDMVEEKGVLAKELKSVFQHALAVRDIEVRVQEISPV